MAERLLITGATGLLGGDLAAFFAGSYDVIAAGSRECDIRDHDRTMSFIESNKPDIVLHAAAWADVDACERDETLAMAINAGGAGNVAKACRENGVRMVQYSTDYVFDGTKELPYVEDDDVNPINVYGRSKYAGEQAVREALPDAAILRVAWLYGSGKRSFVQSLIGRGREYLAQKEAGKNPSSLKMVSDQIGTPTWTREVARQTEVVLRKKLSGIVHCTAEGACSRYDMAAMVLRLMGLDVVVEPCRRKDFAAGQAPRPLYTPLENAALKKIDASIMRDYGSALMEFVKQLRES